MYFYLFINIFFILNKQCIFKGFMFIYIYYFINLSMIEKKKCKIKQRKLIKKTFEEFNLQSEVYF